MNRIQQYKEIQKKAISLFEKKNKDYGDAFANHGPIGVLVRIGDKIQRLQHITKNSVTLVNDETLQDTLIDLHNYSAMALMLINEETFIRDTKRNYNSCLDNIVEFGQYVDISNNIFTGADKKSN